MKRYEIESDREMGKKEFELWYEAVKFCEEYRIDTEKIKEIDPRSDKESEK